MNPASTADGAWIQELDIFQSRSRAVPSPLDQLRRRLMVTNNSVGKMMSKKSENQIGHAIRNEDHAGLSGGHNPSGRIRILKL